MSRKVFTGVTVNLFIHYCVPTLCNLLHGVGTRGVNFLPTLVGDIISFPARIFSTSMTALALRKCMWFCFPWKSLVSRSHLFQNSDISSYVGFHCYKISSLFEDLPSMNKTLSISVGQNSHACNGQDLVWGHMNRTSPKRVQITTQQHTPASLSQESGLLGAYDT